MSVTPDGKLSPCGAQTSESVNMWCVGSAPAARIATVGHMHSFIIVCFSAATYASAKGSLPPSISVSGKDTKGRFSAASPVSTASVAASAVSTFVRSSEARGPLRVATSKSQKAIGPRSVAGSGSQADGGRNGTVYTYSATSNTSLGLATGSFHVEGRRYNRWC